ncbi:hypothetical protein [Methylobacterium sp. PvR107]|uniref:hypothetical protein n=1 Tax=Methylobacterium sp. PvR107 TaxID=2806597 RepID=UPI001AE37F45|nr:hypothetical protein [Methylobacterium sp. PvR107]MBP1179277.1 hypothetical protein [Methylobacterium sp. PvR107]
MTRRIKRPIWRHGTIAQALAMLAIRDRAMSAPLIMPLAMAAMFTAGAILILQLEQHAEHVRAVLWVTYLLLATFNALTLLDRLGNDHRSPRVATTEVESRTLSSEVPGLELIEANWRPLKANQ